MRINRLPDCEGAGVFVLNPAGVYLIEHGNPRYQRPEAEKQAERKYASTLQLWCPEEDSNLHIREDTRS